MAFKTKKAWGIGDYNKAFANSIHLKKGNIPDSKFNATQLRAGIKVEMEHTNNKFIAKAIAKAHLSEKSDYYSRLKKVGL